MRRPWLFIIALGILLLGGLVFVFRSRLPFFGPKPAALKITSEPTANVFIDGEEVGLTPFLGEKLSAGEITVRLVPQTAAGPLISWEGKVTLVADLGTQINRVLGPSQERSGGEIFYYEPISDRQTSSLAVISTPDNVAFEVDGEPKGFAPRVIDNLPPGEHIIGLSAPGYERREVRATTQAGYKLIGSIQLIKEEVVEEEKPAEEEEQVVEEEAVAEEEATAEAPDRSRETPPELPYVEIKDTPTGWLRVRADSTVNSEELTKVNPGEQFPLLDEALGWYKIEYEEGKEGWIAGQYAEKFE